MTGRLLMTEDVCQRLGGVKPWTCPSGVSQRHIPDTTVGRLTRFPASRINAWIRSNTHAPVEVAEREQVQQLPRPRPPPPSENRAEQETRSVGEPSARSTSGSPA